MSDLGAIGKLGSGVTEVACGALRSLDFGSGMPSGVFSVGVRRDNVEGNLTPSLVMDQPAKLRFRWAVAAGARSISIQVKQAADAAPYPTLRIIANPDMGIFVDTVATAPAGAGWKTLGPVPIAVPVTGAMWVELENLYNGAVPPSPCYWDNLSTT
jgi:hypothetical protein